jgi:hypothetical protein
MIDNSNPNLPSSVLSVFSVVSSHCVKLNNYDSESFHYAAPAKSTNGV